MKADRRLLQINLQFFASDGPGGDKTEPATAKKLQDARQEGQVAKSKELVTAISLIAIFITIKFMIGYVGTSLIALFPKTYGMIGTLTNPQVDEITIPTAAEFLGDNIKTILLVCAPFFLIGGVVAFIGDLVQVKWKPTTKPLMPKLSKFNPIKGFKRLFSSHALIELFKSVGIIIIIVYVAWNTITDNFYIFMELYDYTLMQAIIIVGDIVINLCIKISVVYLIIGIVDYIYQKLKFTKDMKMTKQEVKDEFKNAEGDPLIKSQIKRKMLQASQKRMMQSLPQADVVITNPTHFAVAIKYDLQIAKAPIVLAKGEDYLAQRIKEQAKEYAIEIVENKPLARMLYYNVDIGTEIPEELYQSVAEILAFVYGLKGKR